jgi:hypothetical protein
MISQRYRLFANFLAIVLDFQILVGYYIGKKGAQRVSVTAQWPENVSAVMHMRGFNALWQMYSSLPTKSKSPLVTNLF